MGYRLDIDMIQSAKNFCCGKLFGYVEDETKLSSYQWLLENGYINGDEYFDYGYEGNIVLRGHDLIEFLIEYIKDIKKEYGFSVVEMVKEIKEFIKFVEENKYEKYLLNWG